METTTTETAKDIRSQAQSKLPDFILAEYVHMCESLLRNEESGEKRAAFFVTLVGGAGGILGFVFGDKAQMPLDQIFIAVAVVAAVLLCFGLLTVRRLIQRDVETDRIIFALRNLRRLFLTETEANKVPNAFYAPYAEPKLREVKWSSFGKGGWLHTVSLVNALLTGVFVFAACHTSQWAVGRSWQKAIALILAVAGSVIVWIAQLNNAESIITTKHEELRQAESISETVG